MKARTASLPPLFIVGAPRSGTSLLYRALALHPGAAWINNYQRHAPGFAALAGLNRIASATPKRRRAVWFGSEGDNAYRYNSQRTQIERFYPQPVEGEPVFEHCGVPEAWQGEPITDRQRRLPQLLERTTSASGGRVLISKRIGHNRADLAPEPFGSRGQIPRRHPRWPRGRLLPQSRRLVAQYGRVVVRGTPQEWAAQGRDPLELCARHWVEETAAINAGLARVPQTQVARITYEDLVAAPQTVLAKAAAFAGLDPDDRAWRHELAAIKFPDKNAAWSADLDATSHAALAVMDDQLAELGYAR